ncbi:unnamed protein product [Tilletia controversa]|nr:unnamed protein product [Tilletia controversa]
MLSLRFVVMLPFILGLAATGANSAPVGPSFEEASEISRVGKEYASKIIDWDDKMADLKRLGRPNLPPSVQEAMMDTFLRAHQEGQEASALYHQLQGVLGQYGNPDRIRALVEKFASLRRQ